MRSKRLPPREVRTITLRIAPTECWMHEGLVLLAVERWKGACIPRMPLEIVRGAAKWGEPPIQGAFECSGTF